MHGLVARCGQGTWLSRVKPSVHFSGPRFLLHKTVVSNLRFFYSSKILRFHKDKIIHNFITQSSENSVKLNNSSSLDNFWTFALDSDSSNIFCKQAGYK